MSTAEVELSPSPHEKFDIVPLVAAGQITETQDTKITHLSTNGEYRMERTRTESTLVKSDFFRTSYPSLNMVISHVDNVIKKISPVAFEPPSYLDESLRKPIQEEQESPKIQHETPETSKSFFTSVRDNLARFYLSQSILPDAYNFISLLTTLCTLGCKAVHTIFMIVTALFPMIEILFHITRFVIDHSLDIMATRNRQDKARKCFVFCIQVAIIFCLIVFIFGSVLLPLCKLGILILYKILAFFTK